ncbi:Thromboxane-A synthase, partial [Tetrabaena socialis]
SLGWDGSRSGGGSTGISQAASAVPSRLPPNAAGPFGLPFLGNLPQIIAMDTTAFLTWAARKYGPVCTVWFGTRPWIVISDVELVRKFSYKSAARPAQMGTFMHVMTGENRDIDQAGIVVVEGEAWRNTRRVFETSIILPSSLEAHLPAIARCLSRFHAVLERHESSGEPLEACQELGNLSLAMTGEIAYGYVGCRTWHVVDFAADGGVAAELVEACRDSFDTLQIENATDYLALQLVFPMFEPAIRWLAHHLPDAKQRRAMRARTKVAEVSRLLMQQWQANKAAAAAASAASGGAGAGAGAADGTADGKSGGFAQVGGGIAASSFMAAMLEGRRGAKQGERLSDVEKPAKPSNPPAQVIAQGFTFILAGFETTSSTLSFVLFLLAHDPEATRRLCAEVDALPQTGAEGLTVEALAQLPYTDAVMKEAMRLYPALSFYFRDTKEDVDLGGGRVVPK